MKELKDYLHLYLGSNVLMSDGKNILPLTGISGSLAISDFIEGAELNLIHTPIHTCRPILRPLSDMTTEESYRWRLKAKSYQSYAATVKYYLDRHFDLFGLIEAGLAIDSTTLKEIIK